jgi:hypothetical protein
MKKKLSIILGAILTIAVSSCTTYYMSVKSLSQQLPKVGPDVPVNQRFYNKLERVIVQDKQGNNFTLPVTDHTGVRVTGRSGEHKIVLFNTMFIKDSLLYANKSHFINIPIKPFLLRDITKLEVQN